MIGDGAHAVLCGEDVTMIIIFESAEQQRGYLADVIDSQTAVSGDRWAVVTDAADDFAKPLGGVVVGN